MEFLVDHAPDPLMLELFAVSLLSAALLAGALYVWILNDPEHRLELVRYSLSLLPVIGKLAGLIPAPRRRSSSEGVYMTLREFDEVCSRVYSQIYGSQR